LRSRPPGRPRSRAGSRTWFVGAILDWVGDESPTSEAIAGTPVLESGKAHVRLITYGGGAILGLRPPSEDGIDPPATVDGYRGDGYAVARAEQRSLPAARRVVPPYPEMTLRAYGSYDHSIVDLEFLRSFPTLRRLGADALWTR
jgi:hypothetical protein